MMKTIEVTAAIIIKDGKEEYERETDDTALEEIFEIFRRKNEDEFDFE